jgi:chromate transporter
MRQELVQKSRWVSPEEFIQDFALSQLAPGINIVAMAVILGRRHGGARGVALAWIIHEGVRCSE